MYKHVIWDFDGTLFDTYPAMAAVFLEALREYGVDEDYNDVMRRMKVSMYTALEHYAEKYSLDEDLIRRYKPRIDATEDSMVKPFPHVAEVCAEIVRRGGCNYLYTHRGASSVEFIKRYQMDAHFTDYITGRLDFPRKPDPAALLYLLDKHGIPAEQAIMIGDRDIDLLAAKNAGISACYFGEVADMPDVADYCVQSYDILLDALGM